MKHIQKLTIRNGNKGTIIKAHQSAVKPVESKAKIVVNKIEIPKPLINILTRTSGRPLAFKRCHESVKNQTYQNVRHIVSIDNLQDEEYVKQYGVEYFFMDKDVISKEPDITDPKTGPRFIYNLYLNKLIEKVNDGWIIILDDDDYLADNNVLQKVANLAKSNTDMLLWQMKYPNGGLLPSLQELGTPPRLARIGMPCFAIHSGVAKTIKFDGWKCGDFRFIQRAWAKTVDKRVIKEPLVSLGGAGFGQRNDIGANTNMLNKVSTNSSEISGKSVIKLLSKNIEKKIQYDTMSNSKNQIYTIDYTYKFIINKIEKNENFTFLRFGDNDFMHILGINKGKALGHNGTVYNDNLKRYLEQAITIDDLNYIRTYNFGSYSIDHEFFKLKNKNKLNNDFFNYINSIDKNKTFHSVLFFYSIIQYFPGYLQNIFSYIKNSENVLYIGGIESKYVEPMYGNVKYHLKTDMKNSTSKIDYYIKILDEILKKNNFEFIILACGQLSRVLGGYIFKKYGNISKILDVGGINETFYPNSTKSSVVKNKQIYQKNFLLNYNNIEDKIGVIMCTWNRIERLEKTLNCLSIQTYKNFNFYIWNNNYNYNNKIVDIIKKYPNLNIEFINSEFNIGGIGRFHYAKKICNNIKKIVFIDDDQEFEKDFLKIMSSKYKQKSISSWFGFSVEKDYYYRTRIKNNKEVDYCGTGGMILDSEIFNDEEILKIPEKYVFIEDLWLSFYAKYNHGYNLYGIDAPIKIIVDKKDQFTTKPNLRDLKIEFYNYLIKKFRK